MLPMQCFLCSTSILLPRCYLAAFRLKFIVSSRHKCRPPEMRENGNRKAGLCDDQCGLYLNMGFIIAMSLAPKIKAIATSGAYSEQMNPSMVFVTVAYFHRICAPSCYLASFSKSNVKKQ